MMIYSTLILINRLQGLENLNSLFEIYKLPQLILETLNIVYYKYCVVSLSIYSTPKMKLYTG